MASRVASVAAAPSALGVFLAFCGMFAVGSLAVQLIASAERDSVSSGSVESVVAHPSTLWQTLGER